MLARADKPLGRALIFSASATEVPPNFITTVWARSGVACAMAAKDSFRPVRDHLRSPSRSMTAALALVGIVIVAAVTLALRGGAGGGGGHHAARLRPSPDPTGRSRGARSSSR